MTRSERIRKLASAIKDYRGAYVEGSNPPKWIRRPDLTVKFRIEGWLKRLGIRKQSDHLIAFRDIDAFKSHAEMNAWLESLEKAPERKPDSE